MTILRDKRLESVFLGKNLKCFNLFMNLSFYLFIYSFYGDNKNKCFIEEADKVSVCSLLARRLFNRKSSCLMNKFHLFVSLVDRGYVCTRLWPDNMKLAEL